MTTDLTAATTTGAGPVTGHATGAGPVTGPGAAGDRRVSRLAAADATLTGRAAPSGPVPRIRRADTQTEVGH